MKAPINQLVWLTGGFLLGVLFMYNAAPVRVMEQGPLLSKRQVPSDNEILKFGNPGTYTGINLPIVLPLTML